MSDSIGLAMVAFMIMGALYGGSLLLRTVIFFLFGRCKKPTSLPRMKVMKQ